MKASKVANVVAALLATDAKPTEAQILAAILAADKKGKDGLGPEKLEEKDTAKDEKDDPENTNAEDDNERASGGTNDKAKDKAKDKDCAEDEDDPDMGEDDVQPAMEATPGPNAGKKMSKDKKGMDAAIKLAIDKNNALHAARQDVETVLGAVTYDSAAEVYKAALVKLGVDGLDDIHPSAYAKMFKLARDKREAETPVLASDAASIKGMADLVPGYSRLK